MADTQSSTIKIEVIVLNLVIFDLMNFLGEFKFQVH